MTRSPSAGLRSLLGACLLAAGCDAAAPGDRGGTEPPPPAWRHAREYDFVAAAAGEPLLVPLRFEAREASGGLARSARAWLARGERWDAFLDERWVTAPGTGAWRVLPRAALRVAAGPAGVSALWYDRQERSLRLEMGGSVSGWLGDQRTRFRVRDAELRLGGEVVRGVVLEEMDLSRSMMGVSPASSRDLLLLTAEGDSLRLLVARSDPAEEARSREGVWLWTGGAERAWGSALVRRTRHQPMSAARREVPIAWSFAVPDGELRGEVRALGLSAEVGEERAGRRVTVVRYSVEGWVERRGERVRVVGLARHEQG